ncbi:MAG TPA: L,D-transpeptidase family protein [Fibrobacteria bacterium]|nr:L,D-transpeptidase family protein [Fibrobacteria bacterium]
MPDFIRTPLIRTPFLPCLIFLGSALAIPFPAGAAGSGILTRLKGETVRSRLHRSLAVADSAGRVVLGRDTVAADKDLSAFYRAREFKAAWLRRGNPVAGAWQLLDAVRKSGLEGLEPSEYHGHGLDSLLRLYNRRPFWHRRAEPATSADLDLLLTDAYLKLSRHLLSGRVKPKMPQDTWHVSREKTDPAGYLDRTLREKRDVRVSLQMLTPPQAEYGKMKYWLGEYRRLAEKGGWGGVPDGPSLGPKSTGPRVAALCARLRASGEFRGGGCGETFSAELGEAVKRYQGSHGLDTTGEADGRTLRSLNVSVGDRIDQIELNLECWRWLPRDLGERHIRVNIVDYRLGAYEKGREVFSMKVVVGRKEDSTPVFSDRVVSVQLNPSWNVPASIAGEEMLPELRKDPEYLAKHDMELLRDWSESAPVIRADSVDWADVDSGKFQFRIRQKNGDASALGRIKFVLTNPFNIYLHDTPARKYFDSDKRALSHGCVRLADPMKLARWVLGEGSVWTPERLSADIAKGDEEFIPVPGKGVPVHILYWTCFVDREGGLQFRPDVYSWNRKMEAALVRRSRSF